MLDADDYVCVSHQSNAEIKAKPAWSSTWVQDCEFQLENNDFLNMVNAFALAISMCCFTRIQQRRLPLSIEYKRSENPEIPSSTFPSPQIAEIKIPARIGAASEDQDDDKAHPETNSTPAQQGPDTVAESSAGRRRFGITAYPASTDCLRRFFGPTQSTAFGK